MRSRKLSQNDSFSFKNRVIRITQKQTISIKIVVWNLDKLAF